MVEITMTVTHGQTCEARHIPADLSIRLVAIEGIKFSEPLPIEQVIISPPDGDMYPDGRVQLAAWHDRAWMFGFDLLPDDLVTFEYQGTRREFPAPPDRTDQVRVHGTWKQRGEVDWAPNGHPFQM